MNWWYAIATLKSNFDAYENQDLSSQRRATQECVRIEKIAHIFIKNVNNQIIVHIQCSSFGCLQSLLFGTHSLCGSRQYIVISSVKIIANNSHKFYFNFSLTEKRNRYTHTHTSNGYTHTNTGIWWIWWMQSGSGNSGHVMFLLLASKLLGSVALQIRVRLYLTSGSSTKHTKKRKKERYL